MNFQDEKNQKINFDQILSKRSGCGLIWNGTVESQPCVIKMIMLTSGIHYDKTKQIYCQGDQSSGDDGSTSYVFASGNLDESQHLPFRLIQHPPNRGFPGTPVQPFNRGPHGIRIQPVNRGIPGIPMQTVNQSISGTHMQTVNQGSLISAVQPVNPVQNHRQQLRSGDLKSYFEKNDNDPYRHREFRHRRAINRQAFLSEITELTHLGLLNLAPKVYGYYFSDPMAPIHYGFIVMEKVDSCVKNILYQRALKKSEEEIINQLINYMHQSYGSVHGDLQPSNIGVYLNHKGQIWKACFFDCQKIKHKEKYSSDRFQKLIEKDWKMYHQLSQVIRSRTGIREDAQQ